MLFLLGIDDIFDNMIPGEAKKLLNDLNKSKVLKMPQDSNSNLAVLKRMLTCSLRVWVQCILDLTINFCVWFTINFQFIFFNYFMPYTVLLLEVFGFFMKHTT